MCFIIILFNYSTKRIFIMLNTLTVADAKLLFNDSDCFGFKQPDLAYICGTDYDVLEQVDEDFVFSNYWFGKTENILKFSETLIAFLDKKAKEFANVSFDDIYGAIFYWKVDESHSMISAVFLDDEFILPSLDEFDFGKVFSDEVTAIFSQVKQFNLVNLLENFDYEIQSYCNAVDIAYSACDPAIKNAIAQSCITDEDVLKQFKKAML